MTQSNNSFNASGMSAAFIRMTWMLGQLCAAGLIRALDRFAHASVKS